MLEKKRPHSMAGLETSGLRNGDQSRRVSKYVARKIEWHRAQLQMAAKLAALGAR
jgi:hypothetical protein